MAITVVKTIRQSGKYIRVVGTVVSGDTSADTALALDISGDVTLTNGTYDAYTHLKIINVTMSGGAAATVLFSLRFDATNDVPIIGCGGGSSVSHDFTMGNMQGHRDPKQGTNTGDIIMDYAGTGFASGDECVYSFEAELI